MDPSTSTTERHRQRGVTTAELAVVSAIAATLVAAAAPDFSVFIANAQLRTASESLRGALRLAQIEAIKRQAPVELVLTDQMPISAAVEPAPNGHNWVVRMRLPDGGFELIRASSGATQAPRVQVQAQRGVFAFDPFGRLRADSFGNPAPVDRQRIELADRDAIGRLLWVVVSPTGSTSSCDPRASQDDPLHCG
ncbi:MAG: GspH/FimT family pseudopilin [Caulobacteraceae bacterium]|nr:GspH/FimT family pseudopilin [Caulobacteraceae bacterium]